MGRIAGRERVRDVGKVREMVARWEWVVSEEGQEVGKKADER